MLETHLKSVVTQQRLRTGPAAEHVDAFADWLHLNGYKPVSIDLLLRSLAGWTDWLLTKGFTSQDLVPGLEACKLALKKEPRIRYSRGPNRYSMTAAAVFIRFLQQYGRLPVPAATQSASEVWPLLGEFRAWMRQHRGLTESTLDLYEGIVVGLREAIGDDPGTYTADVLRTFVFDRARPHGMYRAKSIVVAVRAFVRFLGATGQCPPGMEYAIPGFANWQLSSIPRFLVADDVERVIGSCAGHVFELRDRAVLLLLARLGLRASEVAHLCFVDIDWRGGRLTISGKGRRRESLPLPQEVGDAILRYLHEGRPPLRAPELFISALAPFRPLTRASVTHIVRSALRRAGVKAPVNGAHVLRHSAATTLLGQGTSLAGVGAVLRHRDPMTTTHYAKVDFALLLEIAQPWPEVSTC